MPGPVAAGPAMAIGDLRMPDSAPPLPGHRAWPHLGNKLALSPRPAWDLKRSSAKYTTVGISPAGDAVMSGWAPTGCLTRGGKRGQGLDDPRDGPVEDRKDLAAGASLRVVPAGERLGSGQPDLR